MAKNSHVVITGTGRAGTSFLVELLTHLGFETGFSPDSVGEMKDPNGRAGLEHDIRQADCPYIVKSPYFCDYAGEIIRRDDKLIEHVFIPVRDLIGAAQSRRFVTSTALSKLSLLERLKQAFMPASFAGGLWITKSRSAGRQENILLKQLYKLVFALSDAEIPVTLIRYPRLTKDCPYLFGKLKPVLRDMAFERFHETFNNVVRPELVHRFNENDC